jgi:ADP-ribose pyrophosphatase YjhB (NUDIX family)
MEKAVSAGGIIVKDRKIVFVKLPDGHVVFSKGHIKEGETYEKAAIREVMEETGLTGIKIIRKLGVVTRPAVERDGTKVIKDIHMFLMGTDDFSQGPADEETVWLTTEEALPKLFPQEAEFLKDLNELNVGVY